MDTPKLRNGKSAQIKLSACLGRVLVHDLRDKGLALTDVRIGEHNVGGGLRSAQVDVSEFHKADGLTLAFEIKPVHLAVGRAIWNRFGDFRSFAVNVHLKFPFAVLGGVMTVPTKERSKSGKDEDWKPTVDVVRRVVARLVRAGSRFTEADAAHLLEGIGVVVFDYETATIDPRLPAAKCGLRWDEFIDKIVAGYNARFGTMPDPEEIAHEIDEGETPPDDSKPPT